MKEIAVNKKAYHDYEILETFEAGIKLLGSEVKSCKAGQVNLKGAYIKVAVTPTKHLAYIIGMHIAPYKFARQEGYDPLRTRELLLHKKEILKLAGKVKEKGLSIIPLKLYQKNGLIKLEIGLCKGKKLYDKREELKKKAIKKEMKIEGF